MSEYSEKLRRPCRECPFKRKSTRGYLGADYPEHFLEQTLRGADMPCHMEIDYGDPDWAETQEPTAPMCRGALEFQNNWMSLSRNPKVAAAQHQCGTNPNVFDSPEEFLIHHKVGKHSGPTENGFLWRATEVDQKRGLIPFAEVEAWSEKGDEDYNTILYVARDENGTILHVLSQEGRTIDSKDWLAKWAGGGGKITHHEGSPEYIEALRKMGAVTK
jgi:hypothetical protein